mgnify:CR=1 FL=1
MIEQRRLEDYMRIIYLQKKENGCVKSATISRIMHVSRPTVSVALKRMAADGYLVFDENSFLHLTDKGEALAKRMTLYHDTIQSLFVRLGMSASDAEQEAHQLEHALTPLGFEALERLHSALLETPLQFQPVESGPVPEASELSV